MSARPEIVDPPPLTQWVASAVQAARRNAPRATMFPAVRLYEDRLAEVERELVRHGASYSIDRSSISELIVLTIRGEPPRRGGLDAGTEGRGDAGTKGRTAR